MINDNKNITTNTKTDIGNNSDTNTSNDNYDNNGIIADDNNDYCNKSNDDGEYKRCFPGFYSKSTIVMKITKIIIIIIIITIWEKILLFNLSNYDHKFKYLSK